MTLGTRKRPSSTAGALSGSSRALATSSDNILKQPSTLLEPVLSLREADVAPLPSDQYVEVPIPLYFQGHAYRAGSRIRLTLSSPNGDQPIWAFADALPQGTAQLTVGRAPATPSRLVLPVVPGLSVPTGLPACDSLRNEPCRPYVPVVNATTAP